MILLIKSGTWRAFVARDLEELVGHVHPLGFVLAGARQCPDQARLALQHAGRFVTRFAKLKNSEERKQRPLSNPKIHNLDAQKKKMHHLFQSIYPKLLTLYQKIKQATKSHPKIIETHSFSIQSMNQGKGNKKKRSKIFEVSKTPNLEMQNFNGFRRSIT